jgi:hypothetical protein
MAGAEFRESNHFLPQMYQKRFAASNGKPWRYRFLVEHPNVPVWDQLPLKKAASHRHLYTLTTKGSEIDDVERFLADVIENPAEEAFELAVTGGRMNRQHWKTLIRFCLAQDIRTPAAYMKSREQYPSMLAPVMDGLMASIKSRLEEGDTSLADSTEEDLGEFRDMFPIRSTIGPSEDPAKALLKVEVTAGRKLWLLGIRHLLRDESRPLAGAYGHRWTIVTMPEEVPLFTSDSPVVKVGFNPDGAYNLNAGWGTPGAVLLFPLSPSHLLYTVVGGSVPRRGSELSITQAREVRLLIARHAHREIFSGEKDPEVPKLRPRLVDAQQVALERAEWDKFHKEQSDSERFIDPL